VFCAYCLKWTKLRALFHTELLGFWLFPSPGVLENRKHGVSETGFVSVLRWGEKTPTPSGPFEIYTFQELYEVCKSSIFRFVSFVAVSFPPMFQSTKPYKSSEISSTTMTHYRNGLSCRSKPARDVVLTISLVVWPEPLWSQPSTLNQCCNIGVSALACRSKFRWASVSLHSQVRCHHRVTQPSRFRPVPNSSVRILTSLVRSVLVSKP
jgi:hypothetical protein